jgi:fibronectin-binding autotransporter adhesin
MPDRYWVGGTANWDGTAGTKWATTSGGAGGASVPTSADDVYFDAASGAVTCTIATGNTGAKSITCTGFTGTIAGSAGITLSGSLTLSSGLTFSHIGLITFVANSTLTTFGKAIGDLRINATGITVQLADALTTATSRNLSIDNGTFTTNNYSVSVNNFFSNSASTRVINFGSSTVTVRSSVFDIDNNTGLTFNAGTSLLSMSTGNIAAPNGTVFYDVSFAGNNSNSTITGSLVFNNLSFAGRTSAGVKTISTNADQTINGTLTLSAGTNATARTFVRSDTIGTTRTLTCAAVASLTDIDFRDITIAGAAAPVSGTRLGDCKGNSGITFPAAKTVYYAVPTGNNWGGTSWSFTNGGSADVTAFPLAQDTAVFPSSPTVRPGSGGTASINASYNIGTIDMSARTSNTMTLATSTNTPTIYGNWINGTGTTLTGTGTLTFAGRGSQTITSAGVTFTQRVTIDSPSGSVTLQDAFNNSNASAGVIALVSGTFDANGYNVTMSGAAASAAMSGTTTRTMAVGSGTWTIAGSGNAWLASTSTNLTVTGTGTISLTSASAKTFAGGGIQTYPTLNQGGTGTLTVTGSNKFANITDTAIGRVQFTAGTTNIFDAFNLGGVVGTLLSLGSTTTSQATLQKSSAWLMGANSTDAGNNTGLSFTAGGGIDYLSVSYINGTVVAPPATSTGNFFAFF